jgi:hypothetical protein
MTTITHPPVTNNGVVTSWLPVTTAWPSIQQCSTDIYSQFGGGLALAFDPYYGRFINTQISCLPPAATLWWSQVLQTPAQTITGLGPLECPQLCTTGTTSVINPMSTFVACRPSQAHHLYSYFESPADRFAVTTPSSSLLPLGILRHRVLIIALGSVFPL